MYTDQSRVEAHLHRELTEDEILIIDDVIAYCSSYVEGYTTRTWLPVDPEDSDISDEPESRFFDGSDSKELHVDGFSEITKIKILDAWGNAFSEYSDLEDWQLFPLNKGVKTSIRLRLGHFPEGLGNIEIEGVWGGGFVPADVVMVVTSLVAKYLQKAGTNIGMYKSENIEGYSYQLLTSGEIDLDRDTLLKTLDRWKRILL